MKTIHLTKDSINNLLDDLLKRSPNNYDDYIDTVLTIVNDIKSTKDEALFKYTKEFDKAIINASNIQVTKEEIEEAYQLIDDELLGVIKRAIANIRDYHEKQKQYGWFDSRQGGTILGQKVTPLNRVGVYVPGGKAAYPSSV